MVGIERREVLWARIWGRMWIVLYKEGSKVGGVGERGQMEQGLEVMCGREIGFYLSDSIPV